MEKTDYQELAMGYASDYLERLLRMETIVGNKMASEREAHAKNSK